MGRIVLIRHGQASFGAPNYDNLSELGREQASTTGAALAARGHQPNVLLQGRMRRHAQTTIALAEGGGWSNTEVDTTEHWDEIDHRGLMQAFSEAPGQKDSRAFQAAYERALRRWIVDRTDTGRHESFVDFTARVAAGLQRGVERAGPSQTAVVVTSAGPISVACAILMSPGFPDVDATAWLRWNVVAVNCAVTTLVVGRRGTHLLAFNEHTHLAQDAVTFR